MTVSSLTSRNNYVGSGITGPYAYTFRVKDAHDLLVIIRDGSTGIETALEYPGDYQVSGVGNSSGGAVTLTQTLVDGDTVSIRRATPLLQTTDLRNQGSYQPSDIEDALDVGRMIDQDLSDKVERSVRLSDSYDPQYYDPTLPAPEAGAALVWNVTGTGLDNATLSDAQLSTWSASQNQKIDAFVVTTDFVAGATTTLTLSAEPGDVANVSITRRTSGAVVELMTDEFSVAADVVTFVSPIPTGTTRVEVRYFYTYQVNRMDSVNATWNANGTGARARSVRDKLRERISVQDFAPSTTIGDGVTDDALAFSRAMAAAALVGVTRVYIPAPSVAFTVSTPITVTAGITLDFEPGAEVRAMAGYSANHLVELKTGAAVLGATINAVGLPHQSADWLGVGNPVGCPVIADGTVTPVVNPRLENVAIKNAPNGCVFFRNVSNPYIARVVMTNIQTDVTHVRSSGIELYNISEGRVVDCEINGYTMKGYNLGNASRVKVIRCHAYGPGQNIGHASHYEDGCTDCAFIDCNHEGVGFGYKSHNGTRPRLKGFVANGSAAMAYIQSSRDFTIDDCEHVGDGASRQCIIVEGITPAGGVDGGTISNCRGRRSVQGSTLNHIGVQFIADATASVDNVTVRDCSFENQYLTCWTQSASGASFSNIVFDNVRSKTPTIGSFLLHAQSVRVSNCRMDDGYDGSIAIMMFNTPGTTGTVWELLNNHFYGLQPSSEAIWIGVDGTNTFGTKIDTLVVRGNRTSGGSIILRVDLTNSAGGAGTNYIKDLIVQDNTGHEIGNANAMLLTFNTGTTSSLYLTGNRLTAGGAGRRNVVITNPAQVVGGTISHNDVNAILNRPTACGPFVAAAMATTSYAPGTIAAGASGPFQPIFCSGALLGMQVDVTFSIDQQGLEVYGYVAAANDVRFYFKNASAVPITVGTGTVTVVARALALALPM